MSLRTAILPKHPILDHFVKKWSTKENLYSRYSRITAFQRIQQLGWSEPEFDYVEFQKGVVFAMNNLGQFIKDGQTKNVQKMFINGADNKYYQEVLGSWKTLNSNDRKLGKDN